PSGPRGMTPPPNCHRELTSSRRPLAALCKGARGIRRAGALTIEARIITTSLRMRNELCHIPNESMRFDARFGSIGSNRARIGLEWAGPRIDGRTGPAGSGVGVRRGGRPLGLDGGGLAQQTAPMMVSFADHAQAAVLQQLERGLRVDRRRSGSAFGLARAYRERVGLDGGAALLLELARAQPVAGLDRLVD